MLTRDFLLAMLCLLLAMVTIQSGASIAKQLFPIIGPEGTTAFRLGFSALFLFFIFRPWRINVSNWRPIIVYGLCLGGMNLSFYFALERIPLGIGVALEFTGPLAVALFSSKKIKDYLWVCFALLGIVLLLPDIGNVNGLDPIGVALALLAGGFWAGYIIYGKQTGNQGSGASMVALGMLISAIIFVPVGVISQGSALLDWSIIPLGIMIGILSSALPYTLEMFALKRMSSQSFGITMSLEPAIAAIAGLLFLAESLSLQQWAAIIMIITASIGSNTGSKQNTGI